VDGEARVRHAVVHADARRVGQLVRAAWSQAGARATARGASRGAAGTAARGDATRALRELHELLIAPVAQGLPRTRGSRLTIVPHGPLFRLSFGALRSPSGRYLLEDYEIHYTPSVAVLTATAAMTDRAASTGALVVAAPSLRKELVAEGLEPLPGARAEGRAVAALSGARALEVLTGTLATESSVRQLAGERRLLHFATHAVVSDDHPLDSFLALASDRGSSGHDADGRLTAEEVYGLRLDANLVVLSACRTAGGRVTGDGIGGLVRAFVYAGTPSVVATLWDLPDAAGAFALPRFYSAWERGTSKATALRSAQLALLRALRTGRIAVDTPAGRFALPEHPALWAGLVLIGEP
jgi:CHAT domain-containing protein